MKTTRICTLLAVLLMAGTMTTQAQNETIRHSMLVDTTSVVFKEVYRFWRNYKQAQMEEFVMRNRSRSLKTADFWAKEELAENPNPDIILHSIYPPFSFMDEEFLGW